MEHEIIETCISGRSRKHCPDCWASNCIRSTPYKYKLAAARGLVEIPEPPEPPRPAADVSQSRKLNFE